MASKPKVQVKQGVLQGKVATTYNGKEYFSFEGIPYAKPPVGELRFRAPQPPEPWQDIRDATKPGNRCAQIDPYRPTKLQGSEDCLYLNVYTPELKDNGKKLPVVFCIHGGRFMAGYGDYYKPDFFLEKDVVVVTINYRLHILGFLCLHTAEVPGNAGLKDAIAALRWVNENIGLFNGDSSNVTVFGESAGSGTVAAFLASKMSNNLIHKVIKQSGSCLSDFYLKNEDKISKAKFVVKTLGVETDDVNEMFEVLKKAKVEDLANAIVVAQNSRSDINAFFLPVVETPFEGVESFLVEDPWVLFKEGRFKNVPVLSLVMSHEGAFFMKRDKKGAIVYDNDLENFIPKYFNVAKGSKKSVLLAEKLRAYYFGGAKIDGTNKEKYVDFVSDAFLNIDLAIALDYLAKINPNVYSLRFGYDGSLNMRLMSKLGIKGASHGDALAYQFTRHNKMDKCTAKDLEVIGFMSEALASFAKTGKPTLSGQQEWIPYNEFKRMCLDISDEIKVIPYPGNERVNFWKQLLFEKSRL